MFEMSCGYELTHLRPEQDEYKSVKDEEVKEVLQYIFKEGFPNTIEQVIIIKSFSNNYTLWVTKKFFLSDPRSYLFLC
jgi:hypothetical protein